MLRLQSPMFTVVNNADLEGRTRPFLSDELVFNHETKELRLGPGTWEQCLVLIAPAGAGAVSSVNGLTGDVVVGHRMWRVTSTDAANNVDGSGAEIPLAGQMVYITDQHRVYVGDGINTLYALVAAGNYLVPAGELP